MTKQTEVCKRVITSEDESRHWWLFALVIVALKSVLLALDPLPKLFMGDSACYISTAMVGWIPDDRSYFYGFVIRWLALSTGSLTSLLLWQTLISALTVLLFTHVCRSTFGLPARTSYLLGLLCALDPLQLVWERYVMTETISLFFYMAVLHFAFLYLKHRAIKHLAIAQALAVLLIGFRMSYLLVVQISAVALPLLAFTPLLLTAWRDRRSIPGISFRPLKLVSIHVAASIALMLVLHGAYRQVNGLLCDRSPAYLYATGLHLLAFWAPILVPADASDERLAKIIGQGDEFDIKDLTARNDQRFTEDYLVPRWQEEEPDIEDANQIAKETALHALRRDPLGVLSLAVQTFAQYWNVKEMLRYAAIDLGHHDLTDEQRQILVEAFHFSTDGRVVGAPPSLLQRWFLLSWPYGWLLLLSPILGAWTVYRSREKEFALFLFLHLGILLSVTITFAVAPSLRYLQPVSLLALLTLALCLQRRLPAESTATLVTA